MRMDRGIAGCTRGTAAVEFALISVVLIGLLMGILDFGRTIYVKNQVSYLADRAARKVLLDPDISNSKLEAELRDGFTAGNADDLTVSIADKFLRRRKLSRGHRRLSDDAVHPAADLEDAIAQRHAPRPRGLIGPGGAGPHRHHHALTFAR